MLAFQMLVSEGAPIEKIDKTMENTSTEMCHVIHPRGRERNRTIES